MKQQVGEVFGMPIVTDDAMPNDEVRFLRGIKEFPGCGGGISRWCDPHTFEHRCLRCGAYLTDELVATLTNIGDAL